MNHVIGSFSIPSLTGNGLWSGIGTLLQNYWPVVILVLVLVLAFFFMDKLVNLIKAAR